MERVKVSLYLNRCGGTKLFRENAKKNQNKATAANVKTVKVLHDET